MQINVNNLNYKNIKNISFKIDNNKITGIVCSDIKDLINITYSIGNNIKDSGKIIYSLKKIKDKIGIISISKVNELLDGKVIEYLDFSKINDSMLKILDLNENIKDRYISTLSTTEKIKILFLKSFTKDYDTLLINGIFEELDIINRTNIIKLIINLKKFQKKTIVVLTTDIDIIYEFIDNLVLIYNDLCVSSSNKYSIYNDNKINNLKIKIPFIKKIENMIYNKSNINLGNNDNINELIKAIYRELR